MRTYKLIYLDRDGNELDSKEITALNIQEARKYRDRLFAECMMNDCIKITVKRIYL